ncbi:hypothetical protein BDR26DRAFT_877408, partial [Obelidium mucronatum]
MNCCPQEVVIEIAIHLDPFSLVNLSKAHPRWAFLINEYSVLGRIDLSRDLDYTALPNAFLALNLRRKSIISLLYSFAQGFRPYETGQRIAQSICSMEIMESSLYPTILKKCYGIDPLISIMKGWNDGKVFREAVLSDPEIATQIFLHSLAFNNLDTSFLIWDIIQDELKRVKCGDGGGELKAGREIEYLDLRMCLYWACENGHPSVVTAILPSMFENAVDEQAAILPLDDQIAHLFTAYMDYELFDWMPGTEDWYYELDRKKDDTMYWRHDGVLFTNCLFVACYRNHPEVIRVLFNEPLMEDFVEHALNHDRYKPERYFHNDWEDETCLSLALNLGHMEAAQLFLNHPTLSRFISERDREIWRNKTA